MFQWVRTHEIQDSPALISPVRDIITNSRTVLSPEDWPPPVGFRKKVGRGRKPPRKPRKGANEGSDEDDNADSRAAAHLDNILKGDYDSRLIYDYNRIMRMAALPTHGLISQCRKFTEMSLIAFIHHNGLLNDPNKRLTLDGLISRIKKTDELKVPQLIMEHIETLRKYGNISSHQQIDLNDPSEIWETIETPFEKLGEWVLVDVLSIAKDALLDKFTLHELVQEQASEALAILGTTEKEGSDGKLSETDLGKIFTSKKIRESFEANFALMTAMTDTFAPAIKDVCDKVLVAALKNDKWTFEQRAYLIGYAWRMAFWSPMSALLATTTDYETTYGVIEDLSPEKMGEIIKLMDEWEKTTDKGRKL